MLLVRFSIQSEEAKLSSKSRKKPKMLYLEVDSRRNTFHFRTSQSWTMNNLFPNTAGFLLNFYRNLQGGRGGFSLSATGRGCSGAGGGAAATVVAGFVYEV